MQQSKNLLIVFMVLLWIGSSALWANDSEYYTSANGLVPLQSSNVRLDKEVLTVTRGAMTGGGAPFHVDVKYTLYNEGPSRRLLIGFEAPAAVRDSEGDKFYNNFFYTRYNIKAKLRAEWQAIRKKKYHRRQGTLIDNFHVIVNGKERPYKVADLTKLKSHRGSTPFVGELYYFSAYLKHGVNTIKHRYDCFTSGSVDNRYEFEYILATASHWKGGRIGDFTLRLEMGNFAEFTILATFFDDLKHWKIPNGTAKMEEIDGSWFWQKGGMVLSTGVPFFAVSKSNISDQNKSREKSRYANFYLRDGKATFHQKNFIPRSGLFLYSTHVYAYSMNDTPPPDKQLFKKSHELPFSLCGVSGTEHFPYFAADLDSLRILKAFPYACRGAKFSDPAITAYYRSMPWYRVDPDYDLSKADRYRTGSRALNQTERDWLAGIETLKVKILRSLPHASRGADYPDLEEFLEQLGWYRKKMPPRPSSAEEKEWIQKVSRKESIDDAEFFALLQEYAQIVQAEVKNSNTP